MLNNRELATLEVLHDRVQTAIDEYHDFTIGSLPKRKLDKLGVDVALRMICDWLSSEYGTKHTPDDYDGKMDSDIALAYTELGDENQYPVQVYVNLCDLTVKYQLTDENGSRWLTDEECKYATLNELMDDFLEFLDFNELISPFYYYIEERES